MFKLEELYLRLRVVASSINPYMSRHLANECIAFAATAATHRHISLKSWYIELANFIISNQQSAFYDTC